MKLSKLDKQIVKAATEVYNLKQRASHPKGTFDKAQRFILSDRCECCESIRSPSRAFPFSELLHGRSAIHVAHVHGLAPYVKFIKRIVRILESEHLTMTDAQEMLVSPSTQKQIASITSNHGLKSKAA